MLILQVVALEVGDGEAAIAGTRGAHHSGRAVRSPEIISLTASTICEFGYEGQSQSRKVIEIEVSYQE